MSMLRSFEAGLLTATLAVSALPAAAALSPGQAKNVERYAKTLAKSRNAGERVDAARELGRLEGAVEVVAPLTAALADADGDVRRQAADALWRVGEVAAPAVPALRGLLDDPDLGARVRAAAALEELGVANEELVAARRSGLAADFLGDRVLAARDLVGFVPPTELVAPIVEVADAEADTSDSDLGEVYLSPVTILESLVAKGDASFVPTVTAAVAAGHPGRRRLLTGLAKLEPKPAGWNDLLLAQLASPRLEDREVAVELLGRRTDDADGVAAWIGPVAATLDDPRLHRRSLYALRLAGGHAAPAAAAVAALLAGDPSEDVREEAAETIKAIGERSQPFPAEVLRTVAETALPALSKAAVGDPSDDVREESLSALAHLRLEADEVLPTFVAAARRDPLEFNRFKTLQYIRDLGTDAAAAIPDLEAIIAADAGNREMAEQALDAVKTRPPSFDLEATDAAGAGAGAGAALAALRAAGREFSVTEFYRSLGEADAAAVQLFLDAGMSPGQRLDEVGMQPLHALFFSGGGCSLAVRPTAESTKAIARLLLARGAAVDAQDDRGNTPLKLAVMGCDAEVIRILLAAGADPFATDASGLAPFDLTLWSGTDAAEPLLEAGYRLTAEKATAYREGYKDNPAALALIDRATAPPPKKR